MTITILSTPLLLEVGEFSMSEISLEQAMNLVNTNEVDNFCGHQTVKLLGLEPDTSRRACSGYSIALTFKVNGRLEFGREYTVEEIEAIGYSIFLIRKLS